MANSHTHAKWSVQHNCNNTEREGWNKTMKKLCGKCESNVIDLLSIIEDRQNSWHSTMEQFMLHSGKISVINRWDGKEKYYKYKWDGHTLKFRGMQATFRPGSLKVSNCTWCKID